MAETSRHPAGRAAASGAAAVGRAGAASQAVELLQLPPFPGGLRRRGRGP
ncbi:hypothetical protein HMPREF0731_1336, partial [Pseudoroseomonas cervicalis ATCC 49957]